MRNDELQELLNIIYLSNDESGLEQGRAHVRICEAFDELNNNKIEVNGDIITEQMLIEEILKVAHQENGLSIFKIQDALKAVLADVDEMVEECRVKNKDLNTDS